MIYCNPGKHFSKCWAERCGCSVEFIDGLIAKHELNGIGSSTEEIYRKTAAFMTDLRAAGFKRVANYCSSCLK